jgi:heat shock protein 5
MVQEAEEFADEDKKVKERIDAKNAFDGYLHSLKSAVEGSLKDKIEDEEAQTVKDAMEDGQSWMDSNPESDAEDIKEKHKEIEGICAPIISKHYGGAGGEGGAGGDDGEDDDESHDEL